MRFLVTGGAGFIGHHLVRGLLERGHEVNVVDDFSAGDRRRLDAVLDRIALVEGSILERDALDAAAAGCEVILHQAAIASVARSVEAPRLTDEVNVGGTIEVMLAAARHSVRRVVFASSAAVYGQPVDLPCRESQVPAPTSPYGVTKLAGEHYLTALGSVHGIETVSLRYFNVFGPGQDPAAEYAAVVPRFATAVLDGRPPTINGSGEISRDFVYVDNVVEANVLAAASSSPSGLTCNVASGRRRTLLELLEAMSRAAARPVDPVFGPPRPADIQHSVADIARARDALGYEERIGFDEGIARTLAWFANAGTLDGGSAVEAGR